MRLLFILLAMTSVGIPAAASAACAGALCTDVMIERIFTEASGDVNIRTSGDETQLDCDAGSLVYLKFTKADAAYSEWYAMILTAFVQHEPISLKMVSGTGECKVLYVYQDK